MQLIGMLDSPYVRRVAIAMRRMGLAFEHRPLSVFRDFDAFAAINPAVKAPTLLTDEGVVLMDSTLILDHVERLVPPERRLRPEGLADHARAQRLTGLSLAACEKTVQLVYEFQLRPPERRHAPWIERVRGQRASAFAALEAEIGADGAWQFGERMLGPDIDAAVAWSFSRLVLPDETSAERHPKLARLSERAEALPDFLALPMT